MKVKYTSEIVTSQARTLRVRYRVTPLTPTADIWQTPLPGI